MVACCLVILGRTAAPAQTYTWAQPQSGSIESGSSWAGGVAPPNGSTVTMQFIDGNYTATLSAPHTINHIIANTTGSNTVQLSGDQVNTFTLTGNAPAVTVNGGTLKLLGVLNATALTKDGGGVLAVASTNGGQLNVGTLSVIAGQVNLQGSSTLPASVSVSIGTGILSLGAGAPTSLAVSIEVASLSVAGGTVNVGTTSVGNTLTVNQAGDTTFSGTLLGTSNQTFIKAGAGTLTLAGNGNSSFIGTTQVQGGTLVGNRAGGFAFDGTILVSGTGQVRLDQANQFNADTARFRFVGGGILNVNGQTATLAELSSSGGGQVQVGSGTLTVRSNTATTLDAVITGTGTVRKEGAGTLSLTGSSPAFAGQFQVAQGQLDHSGTIGGMVAVSAGATLHGSAG
jgi:autotransporter-associated beta strand protein